MKYIVARGPSGYWIMERHHVSQVEVYEKVAEADAVEQAGAIADALNAKERR